MRSFIHPLLLLPYELTDKRSHDAPAMQYAARNNAINEPWRLSSPTMRSMLRLDSWRNRLCRHQCDGQCIHFRKLCSCYATEPYLIYRLRTCHSNILRGGVILTPCMTADTNVFDDPTSLTAPAVPSHASPCTSPVSQPCLSTDPQGDAASSGTHLRYRRCC